MSFGLVGIWYFVQIATSLLAPFFIPYLGFFSYADSMKMYHMPDFIRASSNFDGIFYVRISTAGYSTTEQAFFPLYPILIKYLTLITHNPIISGVLISNISFLLALFVFTKYISLIGLKKQTKLIIAFLLLYPTSYYFGVMYNESLFLLLFISTLYFAKTNRFAFAFLLAYLAALTRVVGVFLLIPLVCIVIENKGDRALKKYILVAVAPIAGLASYCYYLWRTTGDPLFFFHSQEVFGAHRSSNLILPPQVLYRYIKIFITAAHNFQYYVAILEFSFYIFALGLLLYELKKIYFQKKRNLDRLGLNLFSIANVIIPSLTGTLTSIPRYTLLSISLFFILAEIPNKYIRYTLGVLFAMLHCILFALFIQGYFVT